MEGRGRGGRVMQGGGRRDGEQWGKREQCEAMEGGGAVHGRSSSFAGGRFVGGRFRLWAFVSIRGLSWVFMGVRGCLCPFMGVCVHSWAFVSRSYPFVGVRVHSCPFVGVRVRSWVFVSRLCPFVGVCVRSWVFLFVRVVVRWRHGWCDMGPVSHVKGEEGGRGVVGLTCMHNARRGTSSSPCTGLVMWRRGVVLGVQWCRRVPWVV